MDEDARKRLRLAIVESDWTASAIAAKYASEGWSKTYVSRILNNEIAKPDPSRLLAICQTVGVDLTYVLTGERAASDRRQLIDDIASASDDVIAQVSAFVRSRGLSD